jgi:tRNA threonylcarbamoyladenosine biosynthesis protein TsaE
VITVVTQSAEDTRAFASVLSSVLRSGDVVLLIGDMGAGKTTFVQGLAAGLDVQEPVTSPTFVLLHTYNGRTPLHHADLYRLEQLDEVLDLGITELVDEGGIALIEWADRAPHAFPSDVLRLELSYGDDDGDNVRRFVLEGTGPKWAERNHELATVVQQWIEAK